MTKAVQVDFNENADEGVRIAEVVDSKYRSMKSNVYTETQPVVR
jgi:hypothetical protein